MLDLNYEFGGDDYSSGEDFTFEINNNQIAEALAYIYIQNNKNKIRSVKMESQNLLIYFIEDLINDEMIDPKYIEDYLDEIKSYWEEEAINDWKYSRDGHSDELSYYNGTRI